MALDMPPQIFDLAKVVGGAVLGGAGTWLAQLHAERRRKRELAETAILGWLDAQHLFLERLRTFSRLLEPRAPGASKVLVSAEEIVALQDGMNVLVQSLHRAMMYERRRSVARLLDLVTQTYAKFLQRLEILGTYEDMRVRHERRVESVEQLQQATASLSKSDPRVAAVEVEGRALEEEAHSLLDEMVSTISKLSVDVTKDIARMIERAESIRKVAVS